MRIAITGSSGLIGTALRRSLDRDRHDVVRLVRPGRDGPRGQDPGTVSWDPAGRTIDAAGLEGLDAVVHLAGEPIGAKRWTEQHKRRILESRTVGTALLSEALAGLDAKPRVLLSASGMDYYGDRGDEVLTEASSRGSGFLADVVDAWEAATGFAVAAGIRVVHLRTGIVLDRSGGALARMLPLFRLGLGGRLGSGRQWWSWISLADEVAAIRFLLDHDVAGPVNLTAPEPLTNAEFSKALGRALHRPAVVPVPRPGPRLLLGRQLADELLFSSKRIHPTVLQEAGFAFQHLDIESGLGAALEATEEER